MQESSIDPCNWERRDLGLKKAGIVVQFVLPIMGKS
nr:MAG TPA: hypothetical protein [Bacteriophage sp.]